MSRTMRIAGLLLLLVAALEFGLLGANAAGLTSANGRGRDGQDGPGQRPTPTVAPPRGVPASIQITPDPLAIPCDPSHSVTLTVRLTDAAGHPVSDGTPVQFVSYDIAAADPAVARTQRGVAVTHLRPYAAPSYAATITVRVLAGQLDVQARIPCRGSCPISPPAVSPPCAPPPPCDSISPPASPPCALTPTPCTPSASPPCVPPPCDPASPPRLDPRCPTPTATPTPLPGPTLSIRADGLDVSLVASGTGFGAYQAYQYVLRVDPAAVLMRSWRNHMSPDNSFCVPPQLLADLREVACVLLGSLSTATGDLATISFAAATNAPGCTTVQLVRLGPPDYTSYSSYTVSPRSEPQANPYGTDTLSLPLNGGSCPATPPTATPSAPRATDTPAPASTPTPPLDNIISLPTDTPTPTPTPSATPVP